MVNPLHECADLLDARRSAVLVVDVQRWFTRPRPSPMFPPLEAVLPQLQSFIDAARNAGALIVRVQAVIPDETYSEVWRRQFPSWGSTSPLGPEEEGTRFHPGFDPQPGDLVVTKHRYSAFFGTTLDSILHQRGIHAVVVTGLTTGVALSPQPEMRSNVSTTWSRLRTAHRSSAESVTKASCRISPPRLAPFASRTTSCG